MSFEAQHLVIQRQLAFRGVAVSFTKTTRDYDESTDRSTASLSTVLGTAIHVSGDPAHYEALGLIKTDAITLQFAPKVRKQRPEIGSEISWSGAKYIARDVAPGSLDGTDVYSHIVISK